LKVYNWVNLGVGWAVKHANPPLRKMCESLSYSGLDPSSLRP
jgi:hypothetical protein